MDSLEEFKRKLSEEQSRRQGMQARKHVKNDFEKYILIGNRIKNEEVLQDLKIINESVTKWYNELKTLSNDDRKHYKKDYFRLAKQITWAVIHYAKEWDRKKEPEFWKYISLQFGFHEDIASVFRNVIEDALKDGNRFLVQGNVKRQFQMTILLHALRPQKSWMKLLDFLYDFYKINLNWTSNPSDSRIKDMVDYLSKKLHKKLKNNDIDCEEDIKLEIDSKVRIFQSGISTLIVSKPADTSKLFGELIANIDKLCSQKDFPINTYQDQLCAKWFEEKLKTLSNAKKKAYRKQTAHHEVAPDYSRIIPKYIWKHYDGETDVQLVLPDIRLASGPVRNADLVIECNGKICRSEMRIYGNELGETLDGGEPISLSGLMQDCPQKPIKLRIEIRCDGQTIYDSKTKLYRQTLLFDGERDGAREVHEKTLQAGQAYTLVSPTEFETEHIDMTEIYDFQLPGWNAYFLELQKGYAIWSDGVPLFLDSAAEQGIQVSKPSESSRFPLMQIKDREYYLAYRTSACKIYAKDTEKYWVLMDGQQTAVSPSRNLNGTDGNIVEVPFPQDRNICHIQVVDQCTERIIFDAAFVLINSATFEFDREFYYSKEDYEQAVYHIHIDDIEAEFPFSWEDEEVIAPFRDGEIHAQIPKIVLEEREGSTEESTGAWMHEEKNIWIENIALESRIKVSAPSGTRISFLLEEKKIAPDSKGEVPIGTFLRSFETGEDSSPVRLKMEVSGLVQTCKYDLANIYYREQFLRKPEIEIKEGKLYWDCGGRFIGAPGKKFTLSLHGDSRLWEFEIDEETEGIILPSDMNEGKYRCEICVSDENPLLEKKIVPAGECTVGDPNRFRFQNQRIIIDSVKDENKKVEVTIRPCYIDQIEFQGEQDTSEGKRPVYHGVMYNKGRYGKRYNFSFEERTKDVINKDGIKRTITKMKVNPVRIVYINEIWLCITDLEKDGLYYYHYYDKFTMKEVYAITDQDCTEWNRSKYSNADFYRYR